MASPTTTVNDDRVCPICIEKFKSPRYLSYNHSFCTSFFYLLTLSVNANPRNPVWVFDVLCVVCTPWVMENLINQRNGQNVSQSMTLFRKLLINQTKYIVNHAWEKMKRKRLRTIVYHTRSICVNNALSIIGEIWHL